MTCENASRLCHDSVPQCGPHVHGPAHVRQDGAAAAGRFSRGLEYRGGLLSNHPAVGLSVCPPDGALAGHPPTSRCSLLRHLRAATSIAYRYSPGTGSTGRWESGPLAAVPADDGSGTSFFRGGHDQSHASKLVLEHRSSDGRGPLFPLCSKQHGKPDRSIGLPGPDGTLFSTPESGMGMGRGLRAPHSADPGLCGDGLAIPWLPGREDFRRGIRFPSKGPDRTPGSPPAFFDGSWGPSFLQA